MAKVKRKSPYPISKKRQRRARSVASMEAQGHRIQTEALAELAIDVWKIEKRAKDTTSSHRVLTACERALERLTNFGFVIDTMMDRPYSENLRMRVVEHEESEDPRHVIECLSPAIFHGDVLIREADVVTRGR
ncbi:MAG: hypothetical protein IT191_09020 [Microbacteriaceae bacterium]|nr:hypothetical protein [Microbacteriaceae bacterium]